MPVQIPRPPGRTDSPQRQAKRQALANVLWNRQGQRRLPREADLAGAMSACGDDVWWVCEANSAGPLYLLPTREWIAALARYLNSLGVRRVLELGAGDGFLSACLAKARPKWQVHAYDNFSWRRAQARMSAADRKRYGNVDFAGLLPGTNVRKGSVEAIARHKPDIVIVSWAPPGLLVERAIRAEHTKLVLDIGVDGDVCGNGEKTWRFNKDFVEGPVETRALCRLDARPKRERKTRVTLYFGRGHGGYGKGGGVDFDRTTFGCTLEPHSSLK